MGYMRNKKIADDGSSIHRRKFLRAIGAGAGATSIGALGGVETVAGAVVETRIDAIDVVDDATGGPGNVIAIPSDKMDEDFRDWCFENPDECYSGCPEINPDCKFIEWGPGTWIVGDPNHYFPTIRKAELDDEELTNEFEVAVDHELVMAVDELLAEHTLQRRPEHAFGYELESENADLDERDPTSINVAYDGYGIGVLSAVLADDVDGDRTVVHAVGRSVEPVGGELLERMYVARPDAEMVHYEDDVGFEDEEGVDRVLNGWRRHRKLDIDDWVDVRLYCTDFPWIECPEDDVYDPDRINLRDVGLTQDGY